MTGLGVVGWEGVVAVGEALGDGEGDEEGVGEVVGRFRWLSGVSEGDEGGVTGIVFGRAAGAAWLGRLTEPTNSVTHNPVVSIWRTQLQLLDLDIESTSRIVGRRTRQGCRHRIESAPFCSLWRGGDRPGTVRPVASA